MIVTGAAQGFGEGIARCLIQQGANIVVADLNDGGRRQNRREPQRAGRKPPGDLRQDERSRHGECLRELIRQNGLRIRRTDAFISNAGVLRAGGLGGDDARELEFVTKINYNAYFYCAQAASRVMKLQNKYLRRKLPRHHPDQSSKSGPAGVESQFRLCGRANLAVSALHAIVPLLELAPFRIKVNAVCPGNFYEGPPWSNPENGLFPAQHLHAGKVPGAKTIEDARASTRRRYRCGKGTGPEDVTKAVLYLIDQTCETGQALPVTGGQVMLS
ncbi:MAG: SDR family NAD(P)-dependent oxidoreductase [Alistipes indistinctus]